MLKTLVKKIPGVRRLARRLGLAKPPPSRNDRRFLLDMLPREGVGAEIGVHLGDFSRQLLDATRPREMHLVDPWAHQLGSQYEKAWYGGGAENGQAEMDERYASVLERFAWNIEAGQLTVHRGYSEQVLKGFPDDYFDWVYIDGNHLYDYVKRDIEMSMRKVKPGGYIMGDDYTAGGWWEGGVKKAVDEVAASGVMTLVKLSAGQFIFRVGKAA